jgi:mannose-6-phosphate isomerase
MLYPLIFKPILKQRIWGGSLISKTIHLNFDNNSQDIGESWDICDRDDDQSIVLNGNLSGYTIKDLRLSFSHNLFGTLINTDNPFPLLVKILDAKEDLSLQVHPKLDDLKLLPKSASPKTEFWYILNHNNNAKIMAGLKEKVNKTTFFEAAPSNKIKDYINIFPSKQNMLIYIESGTIHAIGGGNLILEIQQNSDTTYRISDWGRLDSNSKPRELHIKESMICVNTDDTSPIPVTNVSLDKNYTLISNNLFETSTHFINGKKTHVTKKQSCEIISCTNGSIKIGEDITLIKGQSSLIPANIETQISSNQSSNYLITKVVK